MSEALIRPERPEDADAVLDVNRLAFGREDEADLVTKLRGLGERLISLVALMDGHLVGHILFTPVHAETAPGMNAYGLGPMSVLPELQKTGIGGRLIKAGVAACASRGADAVFVLGHADYYPRFGFAPVAEKGFHYESAEFDPHFFVRELKPGALAGKGGWIQYDPAFFGG